MQSKPAHALKKLSSLMDKPFNIDIEQFRQDAYLILEAVSNAMSEHSTTQPVEEAIAPEIATILAKTKQQMLSK